MLGRDELRSFINVFVSSVKSLRTLDEHLDWRLTGRWMLLSVGVGLLAGVGALVFNYLTHFLSYWFLERATGYPNPTPYTLTHEVDYYFQVARPYLLFIIPTLGGLLVGWLVYRFAPEAEGHGTDGVIKSFHEGRGIIRLRVAIVKTLASALTLGTGGSAGKEGPIAQIGASLASFLAQRLGLTAKERRLLLVAGMGAGIGSIFQAPLAGAFFAVEVLYKEDIESEAIMPCVVGSITGYAFYSTIVGTSTVFIVPEFQFFNLAELSVVPLLALLSAIIGILYIQIFYGFHDQFFKRLRTLPLLRPAIGGLLMGAVAYFFPPVIGSSYGWLEMAIQWKLSIEIMVGLLFLKIIATSFSIGSGGSGGVFAPSLVIGGMLGGVFGYVLNYLDPELFAQPHAYVLVGMGTLFAAVSHTPLSSTIMISELTGSYHLLVPLILGCTLVHFITAKWTLYRSQYPNFSSSPAHRSQLIPNILNQIQVKDVMHEVQKSSVWVNETDTLEKILETFASTQEEIILVRNPKGQFVGIIALEHLQKYLNRSDEKVRQQPIAQLERLIHPFYFLRPEDTLEVAFEIFKKTGYPELPVLKDNFEIAGFLHIEKALQRYHEAFLQLRTQKQ